MERHRGMPSVRLYTSLNQRRLRGPANGEAPSEAMGFEGFFVPLRTYCSIAQNPPSDLGRMLPLANLGGTEGNSPR
jgi:hypothetical protein